VAESAAVQLAFDLVAGGRRAGIGEELNTDGASVVARMRVDGVPAGTVTFHTEKGVTHRADLLATGAEDVEWRTSAAEAGFVRIEVRHPDGRMAALSNPITLI
jgi:hypothetical protein